MPGGRLADCGHVREVTRAALGQAEGDEMSARGDLLRQLLQGHVADGDAALCLHLEGEGQRGEVA